MNGWCVRVVSSIGTHSLSFCADRADLLKEAARFAKEWPTFTVYEIETEQEKSP